MNFNQEVGVRGQQNLQVLEGGKVVRETGVHKNLILDKWFNNLVSEAAVSNDVNISNTTNHCVVGTGSTAPAVTQTTLSNFLAGKLYMDGAAVHTSLGITGGILTIKTTRTWTFPEGAVVGNVSEVGTTSQGSTVNASTIIHTRALVLDVAQEPTSISVGAGEQLRVIHDTFMQFNMTRVSQNIDLTTGGNTTSHLLEMEFCNVGTSFHTLMFSNAWLRGNKQLKPAYAYSTLTFNGTFGAPTVTNSIVGVATAINTIINAGLGVRLANTLPSTEGNAIGGVGGLTLGGINSSGNAMLAIKFTPAIPKSNLNKLTFNLDFTYTRI